MDKSIIGLPENIKYTCCSIQSNHLMVLMDPNSNTSLYKPKGTFIPALSLTQIQTQAETRYKYYYYNNNQRSNRLVQHSNKSMIEEIINEPYYQEKLLEITNTVKHLNNVDIYTDGSLKDLKNNTCSMGIGWFIANLEIHNTKFHASLSSFPSLTKAEIFALLTALIVCPTNSTVDIYLDSANTINTFNKLFIE